LLKSKKCNEDGLIIFEVQVYLANYVIWIAGCGIGCAAAFGKIEDEALRNHPADDFSAGPACGVGD